MKKKRRLEAAERRLKVASQRVSEILLMRVYDDCPFLLARARREEMDAMRALRALKERARIEE